MKYNVYFSAEEFSYTMLEEGKNIALLENDAVLIGYFIHNGDPDGISLKYKEILEKHMSEKS